MSRLNTYEAAFLCNSTENLERVYGAGRRAKIEGRVETVPGVVSTQSLRQRRLELSKVRYLFSTWGMPVLGAAELAILPSLQAVFYAAGSVQHFARSLLAAGITVVSAWAANAVPVAEYTTAQITLAAKGFFRAVRNVGRPYERDAFPGMFDTDIGILGAGMIGSLVISMLPKSELRLHVFDPYLSDEKARRLGVHPESIESVFSNSMVVSNHLADNAGTRRLINGSLLRMLPRNGTFINTGRGATVHERELIDLLSERADLTALLDVTDPEPPDEDSPLRGMENVILTPHIAGSIGNEVRRQADFVIAEFENLLAGNPLKYSVTSEMLETMA